MKLSYLCGLRGGFAALLLTLGMLGGCSESTSEQALRGSVASLQGSIEKRDASALAEVLADDFLGPEGMDRGGARRVASLMFMRYRDVGVTLGPLELEMHERHATVRFSAMVSGGNGLLPERGQVYDVTTGWRHSGDDWELVTARWQPRL